MAELRLAQLLAVKRCEEDGDLGPVLQAYCRIEFARANLKCAERMRDGDVEAAKEYAYTAKTVENFPDEFMRFVLDELTRASS